MPIEDLVNLPDDVDWPAGVCLVGSGPAAFASARELTADGLRVLVLESGGGRVTPDTLELIETEDVGAPLFNGRCRILGGTTEMSGWANRCIAFDPIDYEKRSWVPHSGWPFGPEEIEPFLAKAAAYLGTERLATDRPDVPPPGIERAPVNEDLLTHACWGFGRDRNWAPTKFSSLFREEGDDRLRIILHATVTHLNTDPRSGHIESVEFADRAGRLRTIASRQVVLCAGGIENARLLLNSNRRVATGLGNDRGLVGRFFMDHPRDLNMALTFDPRDANRIDRALGPFNVGHGAAAHAFVGGYALSETVQRREGLLNCAAWLAEEASADDPVEAVFRLVRRQSSAVSDDLRRIGARPGHVLKAAHARFVGDQPMRRVPGKIGLVIGSEQAPDPDSRVTLSDRRDRFGLRIARTDWRVGRAERASQGRLARLIAAEFARLGLPEARLAAWIESEDYDGAVLQDGCHPTGTTRMAADPAAGVVDRHCEVFGVGGLHVAGSSVFPTAGHANPTLMIMAMACRLADRLKVRIRADAGALVVEPARTPPVDEPAAPWPAVVASGTRVAVTGANGFIGGRLVERLVEQGAVVTCLNRGEASARIRRTGAAVETLDLADVARTTAALRDVQVVCHCAYDWNHEDWNERALASLIAAATANRCERFVHVSSYVVYQLPSAGEVTEATEETTAGSGYARIKRQMELQLFEAHARDGFPCAILQPTVVYGPQSSPWTVQPAEMLRYGTVILPDDGAGLCPAVHVDDVVDAMLIAATNPEAVGERFLVSGPEPVTWRDFYERLAAAAGASGPEYLPFDAIERESKRLYKLRRLVLTPERLVRRVAGIRPVGKAVRAAARVLPSAARERVLDGLYGPDSRRRGYLHIPDPGHASWINGRSTIRCEKARRRIGYRPHVDLAQGMAALEPYLRARRSAM